MTPRAFVFSITLAIALTVSACAKPVAPEPIIRTVEVLVPVPIPCAVTVPEVAYDDAPEILGVAPNIFEAMKLRIAGREQSRHVERELRAALEVCRGGPSHGTSETTTAPNHLVP
jgi:hypothetical protein